MKTTVLLIFITLLSTSLKAQDLVIPIEGTVGVDYIIVNYPDWHIDDGPVLVEDGFLSDHKCGTKTYDGHQGTDFVIRSFPQMDSTVRVLAIEAGEIIHVTEDLFDRETDGVVVYGLGNYVGIYHASSNTYSYYAHLKTNSVPVEVGEMVSAGQVIGAVGSSGNSTDPHLHFELWNPGTLSDPSIDPWGIPCDSGDTRWASPLPYDTSYAVWESGFVNYDSVENFIPSTWYPLKERLDLKTDFSSEDPFFTFWALQYGLKMGDETTVEWYEPNGELYASETTSYLTQDWWFHYYNHSIPTPPLSKQGIWTLRYYYNDSLYLTKSFSYGHLGTHKDNMDSSALDLSYQTENKTIFIAQANATEDYQLQIYTISGELLLEKRLYGKQEYELKISEIITSSGIFMVSMQNDHVRTVEKIFISE